MLFLNKGNIGSWTAFQGFCQGLWTQGGGGVGGGRGGGWAGWGWGDKNIIHIASMPKTLAFTAFSPVCTTYRARLWNVVTSVHAFCDHAQNTGIYAKKLVFTAFSPLCTTYCTRMWNKKSIHKRPCLRRPCPKHWYLQCFCFSAGCRGLQVGP